MARPKGSSQRHALIVMRQMAQELDRNRPVEVDWFGERSDEIRQIVAERTRPRQDQ
jgi:hypothetical protein